MHEGGLMGHFGADKTLSMLKEKKLAPYEEGCPKVLL